MYTIDMFYMTANISSMLNVTVNGFWVCLSLLHQDFPLLATRTPFNVSVEWRLAIAEKGQ